MAMQHMSWPSNKAFTITIGLFVIATMLAVVWTRSHLIGTTEGNPTDYSEESCQAAGGTVINTLDYYDETADAIVEPENGFCQDKERLGEVIGLKCPCVCCK